MPTPQGERRKRRAENESELSLSHYGGELHSHSKDGQETSPEVVLETRGGSNCGHIPLKVLTEYHAKVLGNEYIAVTDHSRDGDPEGSVDGVTGWFKWMHENDDTWIEEHFGKPRNELKHEDWLEMDRISREQAKELIEYGDERLIDVQERIQAINESEGLPAVILSGVEANVLPDGSFDSEMVEAGEFEIVNASIHPDVDRDGFAEVIADPEKYSETIITAINHPETNVICHIGFGVPPKKEGQSLEERLDAEQAYAESLDWEAIATAALENDVAIEINLREMTKYLYKHTLNYGEFPADKSGYNADFEERLPQLIPLVSSEEIRERLKPFVQKGLKIVINTDTHENPLIQTPLGDKQEQMRNIRYWRCMKKVEAYFNFIVADLELPADQIINTYGIDELRAFLAKESTVATEQLEA